MWFKRKPENRRIERDHVLGVKLRANPAKTFRNRLAALLLGTLFALLLGVALAWTAGEWALKELIYENKAFALRELDVHTEGVLAVDEIKRWSGVHPGDNLMALDLARVKRDLEMNPPIQSVSIERILPRTLRIHIVEREPIAQINVPRPAPEGGIDVGVFLVDAQGWVMVPLKPHQRSSPASPGADQFAIIGGLDAAEVRPGRRIDLPQVQSALRLIQAFDDSPMAGRADLARIDVSLPEVLTVTTGQGSEIVFGPLDVEQQLRRWREIYDCGEKLNHAIATLDLAITNNIPARWVETNVASMTPPRPVRPPHARRKHV